MSLDVQEQNNCDELVHPAESQDDPNAPQKRHLLRWIQRKLKWRPKVFSVTGRKRVLVLNATLLMIVIAAIAVFSAYTIAPTPVLKIYVWRGYADAAVIAPFESQCHCYVSVHYMDTSDDLYRELKSGDEYDVISASSDIAGDLVSAKVIRKLNKSLITNYLSLKDPLDSPAVIRLEDSYGVPFMWGPNVLIYNTEVFKPPPDSWKVLFDQQYRGRVAVWDDLSSLYMAGLSQDPQADIYNVNDVAHACQWLKELPASTTKLWDDEPDLVKMFRTGQVVAAMGWPLTAHHLKLLGVPVEGIIPKEKTTGWVDYLMIPTTAKHPDLAYKLITHLSDKNAQEYVAKITHTYPANINASTPLKNEESGTWRASGSIRFWQPLGEERRRTYQNALDLWKRNNCRPIAANSTVQR